MAVALQMLRRMHGRLTSAKPLLWDPALSVPLARAHVHLGMTCAWSSLCVLGRERPQLSQGGYAQAKHNAPSGALGPRTCPHLRQDFTVQASQVQRGKTFTWYRLSRGRCDPQLPHGG